MENEDKKVQELDDTSAEKVSGGGVFSDIWTAIKRYVTKPVPVITVSESAHSNSNEGKGVFNTEDVGE